MHNQRQNLLFLLKGSALDEAFCIRIKGSVELRRGSLSACSSPRLRFVTCSNKEKCVWPFSSPPCWPSWSLLRTTSTPPLRSPTSRSLTFQQTHATYHLPSPPLTRPQQRARLSFPRLLALPARRHALLLDVADAPSRTRRSPHPTLRRTSINLVNF